MGSTLPPFLSVLIRGSVYPHAAPFLSVLNGDKGRFGSYMKLCDFYLIVYDLTSRTKT